MDSSRPLSSGIFTVHRPPDLGRAVAAMHRRLHLTSLPFAAKLPGRAAADTMRGQVYTTWRGPRDASRARRARQSGMTASTRRQNARP